MKKSMKNQKFVLNVKEFSTKVLFRDNLFGNVELSCL